MIHHDFCLSSFYSCRVIGQSTRMVLCLLLKWITLRLPNTFQNHTITGWKGLQEVSS